LLDAVLSGAELTTSSRPGTVQATGSLLHSRRVVMPTASSQQQRWCCCWCYVHVRRCFSLAPPAKGRTNVSRRACRLPLAACRFLCLLLAACCLGTYCCFLLVACASPRDPEAQASHAAFPLSESCLGPVELRWALHGIGNIDIKMPINGLLHLSDPRFACALCLFSLSPPWPGSDHVPTLSLYTFT
jgi:hypothetical protein